MKEHSFYGLAEIMNYLCPDDNGQKGETALIIAAKNGSKKCILALLDSGTNVNAATKVRIFITKGIECHDVIFHVQ